MRLGAEREPSVLRKWSRRVVRGLAVSALMPAFYAGDRPDTQGDLWSGVGIEAPAIAGFRQVEKPLSIGALNAKYGQLD